MQATPEIRAIHERRGRFFLGRRRFLGRLGDAPSGDLYAAIAYSPSTGNYASTTKAGSQEEAQTACLNACNADDAVVVTWCKNAFCAGSRQRWFVWRAWANTQADAESQALAACNQDASPNIVASVGAGDG